MIVSPTSESFELMGVSKRVLNFVPAGIVSLSES